MVKFVYLVFDSYILNTGIDSSLFFQISYSCIYLNASFGDKVIDDVANFIKENNTTFFLFCHIGL